MSTPRKLASLLAVVALASHSSPAAADETPAPRAQADAAYEAGHYAECGPLYEKASRETPNGTGDAYNAACCYALSGDVESAFRVLDQALERGYRNPDWLSGDTDLDLLHEDPRWTGVLQRARANLDTYLASVNRELYEMYTADQSERRNADSVGWDVVSGNDARRRARARELVDAGALEVSDDFFHAAMIFQHGRDSTSYRLAYELARTASGMEHAHPSARWLTAAAWDRYLWSVGKPQIYGTQLHTVDGVWTMEPIDTTAVTDAERAAMDVPPLSAARAREARRRSGGRNR